MCTPAGATGARDLVWVDQTHVDTALAAGYTLPTDGTCLNGADQSLTICVAGPSGPQTRTVPSAEASAAVDAGDAYWPDGGKCIDREAPKYPTCVGDQIVWVTADRAPQAARSLAHATRPNGCSAVTAPATRGPRTGAWHGCGHPPAPSRAP